jgi:ADP-ribosylglycohydrolase
MLNRAYGCLIGGAIGDAMGMPASFMTPSEIKNTYGKIIDFNKPKEAQVAHFSLEKGEITDDTEESLIIASVIIEAGYFKRSLFIDKMKNWAIKNKMLESDVIGPSTRRFLQGIIECKDIDEIGKLGDTNGGAMRVAPLGIFYHGNVKKAVEEAFVSAKPSHGSKPGAAATCAIAAAVSQSVEGNTSLKEVMEASIYGAKYGEEQGFDIPAPSVLDRIILAMNLVDKNQGKSLEDIANILYRHLGASMKSYESIPLSLGVFYAAKGDFEKALINTINLGDDADTNGSIVAALCGAFKGTSEINENWMNYIKNTNNIDLKSIARNLLIFHSEYR